MNKYMVANHLKDSDKIKWVKVFKDAGEEKYEFIDNSDEKSSSNEIDKIILCFLENLNFMKKIKKYYRGNTF